MDLEPDIWHNVQLAERSLWILRRCLSKLSQDSLYPRATKATFLPKVAYNVPRVGFEGTGLIITDTVSAGTIFRARIDIDASTIDEVRKCLQQFVRSCGVEECIVKATYPPIHKGYGVAVHEALAAAGFAPAFICELPHENILLGGELLAHIKPLINYFVMEYLPPPSVSANGWITLDDLAIEHTMLAHSKKSLILAALRRVLELLQDKNFVHGDLRPNNIMIKICLRPKPMLFGDQDSLMLRVIDYDWAGELGKAAYPTIRNSKINWPGEDGELIGDKDDEQMVLEWMEKWPDIPQPLSADETTPGRGTYKVD